MAKLIGEIKLLKKSEIWGFYSTWAGFTQHAKLSPHLNEG